MPTYNPSPAVNSARSSQTQAEVDALDTAISDLQGCLRELEDRLGPVLKTSSNPNEKQGATPESPLVPLATYIREKRYRVESLTYLCRDIFSRLEV
jgi:hypothetical protein